MKTSGFHKFVQRLAMIRFNSWWLSKLLYRVDPAIIKKSKGKRSLTTLLTGLPVVIMRSIGAKSRLERTTPLVGIYDGENLILIASYFGSSKHPAWYYNLKENPKVSVEYKGEEKEYISKEVTGAERQKYWELAESCYSGYKKYKKWAGERVIPVMLLESVE